MSLGYVKGKYWVPDDRYAAYAQWPSYKALMIALRTTGITFECTYSYTARRYTAEIQTLEQFNGSAQWYIIKHNNAYDENPLAAISKAIRHYDGATIRLKVICLEIEAQLMLEAYRKAVALEERLDQALDDLGRLLTMAGGYQTRRELVEPLSADPSDAAAAHWENIQSGVITYDPDEDDDL